MEVVNLKASQAENHRKKSWIELIRLKIVQKI